MNPAQEKELTKYDRLNLITDFFNQAYAGEKSLVDYLHYLKSAYKSETELLIWSVICDHLSQLNRLIQNTNYGSYFDSYVKSLMERIYRTQIKDLFDTANKDDNEKSLDKIIIQRLAEAGHGNVMNRIRKIYDDDISGKRSAPSYLKNVIYSAKAAEMTDWELKREIKKYIKTNNKGEKDKIVSILCNVRTDDQIKAIIRLAFSHHVRNGDTISFLVSLAGQSLKGRILVWQFFKQNIPTFKEKFGGPGIQGLITSFFKDYASKSIIEKIRGFLNEVKDEFEGIQEAMNQGYEKALINHDLMMREGQEIKKYLKEVHLMTNQ